MTTKNTTKIETALEQFYTGLFKDPVLKERLKAFGVINKHGGIMKGKLTAIIAGTLFAITGALSASATVKNVNDQHLTSKKQSTLLLAAEVKGNKPSKPADLNAAAKSQARSQAIQSPGYVERGNEIQRLITQLNKMKPHDLSRVKVRNQIKQLNKEREDIVKHYEEIQRGLRN